MSGNGKKRPPLVAERRYQKPAKPAAAKPARKPRAKRSAKRHSNIFARIFFGIFGWIFRLVWRLTVRGALVMGIILALAIGYFYATLPPGGDLQMVETRVIEELARVAAEGVTEAELTKARNIALAEFWRSVATINGKAAGLGEAAVFHGRYERLFDLPGDIEAVSADDLKAVAATVFRRSNATIGVLYEPAREAEE